MESLVLLLIFLLTSSRTLTAFVPPSVDRAAVVTESKRFISRDGWLCILNENAKKGTLEKAADEIANEFAKAEKEKDDLKKQLSKTEALLVRLQSEYTAETNLRPILEEFASLWWNSNNSSDENGIEKKMPGIQKILNQYINVNQKMVDKFIDDALLRSKPFGKAFDVSKSTIRTEMNEIYEKLGGTIHNVILPPDCPTGFIVNETPRFSLAMSVLLMCAGESHTVMANEYRNVVYQWTPFSSNDDWSWRYKNDDWSWQYAEL